MLRSRSSLFLLHHLCPRRPTFVSSCFSNALCSASFFTSAVGSFSPRIAAKRLGDLLHQLRHYRDARPSSPTCAPHGRPSCRRPFSLCFVPRCAARFTAKHVVTARKMRVFMPAVVHSTFQSVITVRHSASTDTCRLPAIGGNRALGQTAEPQLTSAQCAPPTPAAFADGCRTGTSHARQPAVSYDHPRGLRSRFLRRDLPEVSARWMLKQYDIQAKADPATKPQANFAGWLQSLLKRSLPDAVAL